MLLSTLTLVRAQVYRQIFNGSWEAFDPYDAEHRINVEEDENPNTSHFFRSFQGVFFIFFSNFCLFSISQLFLLCQMFIIYPIHEGI